MSAYSDFLEVLSVALESPGVVLALLAGVPVSEVLLPDTRLAGLDLDAEAGQRTADLQTAAALQSQTRPPRRLARLRGGAVRGYTDVALQTCNVAGSQADGSSLDLKTVGWSIVGWMVLWLVIWLACWSSCMVTRIEPRNWGVKGRRAVGRLQ